MPDPLRSPSGKGLMGMPMITNEEDSAVFLDGYVKKSMYLNCLKIPIQLLDQSDQTARSQLRQGFQLLQAFDSLIGSTMEVQKIYTHYLTLPPRFLSWILQHE